ncbi:MAG: ATP-binding protein [Pseudomonadota bacterium]
MRFVPDTLGGRFAVVLVVALLAANSLALLVLGSERSRFVREAREADQIARFAAVADVLASVDPTLAADAARALSTRATRFSIAATPTPAADGTDPRAPALGHALRARLGRAAFVAEAPRRHGRRAILAAVALDGGRWLNVRHTLPRPGRPRQVGGAVVLALALSVVAVLAVALFYTRRMTRPLKNLRAAAERAGAGDRTARVTVAGPREVREASAAFNAMQQRIEDFDAERARTVAAVGHDLRTPITSLRIRAEMLEDGARDAFVKTLDEMRVIADGLLAWGKAGADTEEAAPLDLTALLTELASGGITVSDAPPAMVRGRPVALTRAFSNLFENARRYADGATVALLGSDTVTIRITDSGPGIPEDRLSDILEPFTRLDDARGADTGGAGLGLSIARTILLAHGGTLTLKNREDQAGLIATVTLPRHRG